MTTDLLIDTYGTKIGSSSDRIILSFPNVKEKKEYPIRRLDKIVVLRPASLTTNAVQLALEHDIDILYNEVERMCLYVGLDPYLGLYHSERYGKPALVLDLVEEFRVPIVDMAVFPLFISKEINKRKYFERVGKGQYQLSAEGKAIVVKAVMYHLHREAKWNGKEYDMKKIIENQIRSLARNFMGKESKYKAFDAITVLPIEPLSIDQ